MRSTINTLFIALIALSFSGCQTSSGVMTKGDDIYSIARRDTGAFGSLSRVKKKTYNEAANFCKEKNTDLKIINEDLVPRSLGQFPEAEIKFTCIKK